MEYQDNWAGHRIQGTWVESEIKTAKLTTSMDPSYGKELISYQFDTSLLERSIASAEEWLRKGPAVAPDFLATLLAALKDAAEGLETYLCVEGGKTRRDARDEISQALNFLEIAQSNSDTILQQSVSQLQTPFRESHFKRLPAGVTAAYITFSQPVLDFVSVMTASFFAKTPTIYVSTSQCALVSTVFAKLSEKLELPAGFFQCIFGDFSLFRELAKSDQVQAVLYTGSREHCDDLQQSLTRKRHKRIMLQCGEKILLSCTPVPMLKLPTALAMESAIRFAGQLCVSASRVFIYHTLLDDFLTALEDNVANLKVGPTHDGSGGARDQDMGPLYRDKSVERFLRFQTMARREAEKTIAFGKSIDIEGAPDGLFVTPGIHLLSEFSPTSTYQETILFAPDLAVYTYDHFETALHHASNTDAPYVASVIGDVDTVGERLHGLQVPNILLNQPTTAHYGFLPLANRTRYCQHLFQAIALGDFLTYPQAVLA